MSPATELAAPPQRGARPPRPGTMQEHALEWLRRAIVAGELRPGERVGQDEVAERIGVSIVPVREALRVLEQEGQLTYIPRRGYFVVDLRVEDLEEIYALREVLESRAVRQALPTIDDVALQRIELAARDCAAGRGRRRGRCARGEPPVPLRDPRLPDQPHAMRLIRLLWDSTEAYRALYYNSASSARRPPRLTSGSSPRCAAATSSAS